ncbi:diacylglycerol O-acyltransferase 2-like [Hylaeus volcanicus]|uniref:diacylglycerol O-acyltransferase 2-like n=1 Tax=Hylaeus volcanicus TaxID=313075 RepID=UPI0023B82D95|nr:diacylglycerol O-acyltransferase 2-like [Hylaeus volcanicus]
MFQVWWDLFLFFKTIVYLYIILVWGCDILFVILYCFGINRSKAVNFSKNSITTSLKETSGITITSLPPVFFFLLNAYCVVTINKTWWWYLPYTLYAFLDTSYFYGGRRSHSFRQLAIWKSSAEYFPTKLYMFKSSNVLNDKPFIFCYHPHGIFSAGAILTFASEALQISTLFPGLQIYPCTLTTLFRVPFFRDWLLLQGFISVSVQSIQYVLNKGAGHGIMVVVGGASEAQYTRCNTYDLILLKRKGIFKQALLYGCNVVPVFCFGENNIYKIYSSSWFLHLISTVCKRFLGFCIPPFFGRGVLQDSFGCLPIRHPLHVVFGEPLLVPRNPCPTQKDINQLQKKYCDNLIKLFESRKKSFCSSNRSQQRQQRLRFVS